MHFTETQCLTKDLIILNNHSLYYSKEVILAVSPPTYSSYKIAEVLPGQRRFEGVEMSRLVCPHQKTNNSLPPPEQVQQVLL